MTEKNNIPARFSSLTAALCFTKAHPETSSGRALV